MADVIYTYVFTEWRSTRPEAINQYDITMATYYDIAMVNHIARDVHCDITVGINVVKVIFHGITMHNDVAMNFHYYICSARCPIGLFYYG